MFAVIAYVGYDHKHVTFPRYVQAMLCLFILKICTEIKTSSEKSMFLVPNLYAKNLSAPDDAKSPYEAWFV